MLRTSVETARQEDFGRLHAEDDGKNPFFGRCGLGWAAAVETAVGRVEKIEACFVHSQPTHGFAFFGTAHIGEQGRARDRVARVGCASIRNDKFVEGAALQAPICDQAAATENCIIRMRCDDERRQFAM